MTAIAASDSLTVPTAHLGVSKVSVAAAVAGNVLEFYDFTTYTFFAVMIGQHFFPSKVPFISLILRSPLSASASSSARSAASSSAPWPIRSRVELED